MAFELLQNTPGVAPLLVRLYDTHNLYSLAGDSSSKDAHFELTSVMIDLLNIPLSDRESELIADVLIGLMKKAETELKEALAERLSGMSSVPLRMILALANDDIKIADSVLRKSPLLHDMDLIYILQSKGVEHGRSIARREGIGGALVDMLADMRDVDIAVNLSNNERLLLTDHAYKVFTEMAIEHDVLARPLLMRADLPQHVAEKLYGFVNAELRKMLTLKMGMHSVFASAVLDEIAVEMIDAKIPDEYDMHKKLVMLARGQKRRGELKFAMILGSLRRGQYHTFAAQAAVFFELPMATMKAVLKQRGANSLAIACKAMDICKADFVSLYLLTERFRNRERRVIGHEELSHIMNLYDGINPDRARKMLNDSRG